MLYASLPSHTPLAHKGEGRVALYSCLCFELQRRQPDTAKRLGVRVFFYPWFQRMYIDEIKRLGGARMRSVKRRDMPTCFVFRVSCVKNSLCL